MHYTKLGSSGLTSSRIAFGCAPVMGRASRSESLKAMELAYDLGVTMFDVARSYGDGQAESVLGHFARSKRSSIVISTKYGIASTTPVRWNARNLAKSLFRPVARRFEAVRTAAISMSNAVSPRAVAASFSADELTASVHTSLKELGSNYIDILFLHSCTESHLRTDELFERLESLKDQGKIRAYGAATDPKVLSAVQRKLDVVQFPFLGSAPLALSTAAKARATATGIVANQPFHRGYGLVTPDLQLKSGNSWGNQNHLGPLSGRAMIEFMLTKPLRDGADVVLCSMIRPEHIRANVDAISMNTLSEADYESMDRMEATLAAGTVPADQA